MDYTLLTDADHDQIRRQKLHAIEAEHARLTLDLRLARVIGVTGGDQVTQAKASLAALDRQHAELLDVMNPPEPSPNGSEAPSEPVYTAR